MDNKAISERKTRIKGFLKDGSTRVITVIGLRDYNFCRMLIADLDGSANIDKVEFQLM